MLRSAAHHSIATQSATGPRWLDADLPQRQLLCRLLGVKQTRYAQCDFFWL